MAINCVSDHVDTAAVVNFFFFQAEDGIRDYKVTGVQTCALPILNDDRLRRLEHALQRRDDLERQRREFWAAVIDRRARHRAEHAVRNVRGPGDLDRKSTRLNSSHLVISYAVFCLKKKTLSDLSTRSRGIRPRAKPPTCSARTHPPPPSLRSPPRRPHYPPDPRTRCSFKTNTQSIH